MSDSSSVAAIVVTFNRLNLLKECIDALRNQTRPLAAIIIINNSSTDGTTEWLSAQQDLTTITQENKGGAAGFYRGIKDAYDSGYEWIWCMDDDGLPALNAAEKLMEHADAKPCVMNALVLDKDNPAQLVFKVNGYSHVAEIKEEILQNGAAFFNGTLIHRGVVEKAGFPLGNLTIWGDETEYYNRILYRNHLPIFTVPAARHYHPAQYNVFYKKEWSAASDWKVFFYVRNKAWVMDSLHGNPRKAKMAYYKFLILFAGTIVVYQKKDKLKKFQLLNMAAKDGFAKDATKGITEVRALLTSINA